MKTKKLFNKDFTIMATGQLISLLGNSLQRFALSLLILDLTRSAALFSVILAITYLPQIFLAPFGGVIADRFNKQKIMVILDTISGSILLIFTLFFLHENAAQILPIAILMGVMAIIQSIYDPSVRASIPVVTDAGNLIQANSIVSAVSSLTNLFSPIVAGFLYGIYRIRIIFIINIVSFYSSAVMELFVAIPSTKLENSKKAMSFCQDIKDTLQLLIHQKPLIFRFMLIACSFNLFLLPVYSVGLPYVEKIIIGVSDEMYGISEGLVGAGMIAGAFLTSAISKKLPFQKMHFYFSAIAVLIFGMGCSTFLGTNLKNGLLVSYVLLTLCCVLFTCILTIVNIMNLTYMQTEIPEEYMGKSMALIMSLSIALMPIGQIIFGNLYDIFKNSVYSIYILVAVIMLVITFITKRIILDYFGCKIKKTTCASPKMEEQNERI
ncbi:MAG: MFS transporter [Lachnospiraceae bacterium]|nr:MFS transporter [Lachnospiraceae bacterium]